MTNNFPPYPCYPNPCRKQKDPDADTSALEKQIDQMVYKLYNLTPEEVAIVEGIGVIMEIKHGRLRINNWKLLKPCRV